MFCDIKKISIEELVGHLRAAEDRFEPSMEQVTDKTGRLLLTEEEWVAWNKSHIVPDTSSSSGGKSGGRYMKKGRSGARGGGGSEARDSGVKLTSMGTPRRKGKCCKCGIYGHFTKECKTKELKEERQEAAHHANVDTEQPALMVV